MAEKKREIKRGQKIQGGQGGQAAGADPSGQGTLTTTESNAPTARVAGQVVNDTTFQERNRKLGEDLNRELGVRQTSFDRTNTNVKTGKPLSETVGILADKFRVGAEDLAGAASRDLRSLGQAGRELSQRSRRNSGGGLLGFLPEDRPGSSAQQAVQQAEADIATNIPASPDLGRLTQELEGLPEETPPTASGELGILNDPNTIRNTNSLEQLRTTDPTDTTGIRELPLTATSSRIPGQTGASFQFDEGTVSTTNPERAARLANGFAVRGGQVGTINVDNLVQSNRAESIQRAISEGNRLGASPGDILDKIRQLEGGSDAPRDRLAEQLDNIDRAEASGAIGSVVAEGRRNRINAQITARERNDITSEGQRLGAETAAGRQAISQEGVDVQAFNAGTRRQQAIADTQRKNSQAVIAQGKSLSDAVNGTSSEPAPPIGTAFQTFGIPGIVLRTEVINAGNILKQDLGTAQDQQDVEDFITDFKESTGLTGLTNAQVQEITQQLR